MNVDREAKYWQVYCSFKWDKVVYVVHKFGPKSTSTCSLLVKTINVYKVRQFLTIFLF